MLFSKIRYLSRIKELYMSKVEENQGPVRDALGLNKGSVSVRFKIDATKYSDSS